MGRWWTIDPKAHDQPWQSPYCSMDNNPIWLTDILGDISQAKDKPITHKVKSGENLTVIAKKYNTTIDEIVKRNGLKDKNFILVGQVLDIPVRSGEKEINSKETPVKNENKTENPKVELLFNGKTLSIVEDGKNVFSVPAVSGRPLDDGSFDYTLERQKKGSTGPIPEGKYSINPKATQKWVEQSYLQRTAAIFKAGSWPGGLFAWGYRRTWITPNGAQTYGRNGFSIHGGTTRGSAGCIDVTTNEVKFFYELQKYSNLNSIPLIVDY